MKSLILLSVYVLLIGELALSIEAAKIKKIIVTNTTKKISNPPAGARDSSALELNTKLLSKRLSSGSVLSQVWDFTAATTELENNVDEATTVKPTLRVLEDYSTDSYISSSVQASSSPPPPTTTMTQSTHVQLTDSPYAEHHSFVCGRWSTFSGHQPQQLSVVQSTADVKMTWRAPNCTGRIRKYSVQVEGAPQLSSLVDCSQKECHHYLRLVDCDFCLNSTSKYTFRVAAVLDAVSLLPSASVVRQVNVQPCRNFQPPSNSVFNCDGRSATAHHAYNSPQILWHAGSTCRIHCPPGFGFYQSPADAYTCRQNGSVAAWSSSESSGDTDHPVAGCLKAVPISSAKLRYRIFYPTTSVRQLEHQFEGLISKYSDVFCSGPEDQCTVSAIDYKPVALMSGAGIEVALTLEPPLVDIVDQAALLDTVDHVLTSGAEDNAFMTLVDYANIQLLLPVRNARGTKVDAEFCCRRCPEGFVYRLGQCVQCPDSDTCLNSE